MKAQRDQVAGLEAQLASEKAKSKTLRKMLNIALGD